MMGNSAPLVPVGRRRPACRQAASAPAAASGAIIQQPRSGLPHGDHITTPRSDCKILQQLSVLILAEE